MRPGLLTVLTTNMSYRDPKLFHVLIFELFMLTLSATGKKTESPTGWSSHLSAGRTWRNLGPTIETGQSGFKSQLCCY